MSLPPGEPVRIERYEQPVYEYTRPVVMEQQAYTTTTTPTPTPAPVASTSTAVPIASTSAAPPPAVAAAGDYRLRPAHEPGAGILERVAEGAPSSTIVEVRDVTPGALGVNKHYGLGTIPPRRPSRPYEEVEGGFVDYEHEHRRYMLHLGPNPSVGKSTAMMSDVRTRDFDEAMERRRLEATQMRLVEATGFRKRWYMLENESLADRTRYPIKLAGVLQVLNLFGFLGAITITILTVSGVWTYSYQGVWDNYTTRFTPAAYVLAIWCWIYFFMALFTIYQILPYQRTNLVLFHDIGILFAAACVLQILTDLFYGLLLEWAAAGVITGLLLVLLIIYVRIGIGWKKAVAPLEYFCIHVLFSSWAGYISTLIVTYWATAAYAGVDWYGQPWTGQGWAIIFMCLVVLFTLLLLFTKRDGFFGLAVGWTLIAIARKNDGYEPVPTTFYIVGGVIMVLSLVALAIKFVYWRRECRDREVVILKP